MDKQDLAEPDALSRNSATARPMADTPPRGRANRCSQERILKEMPIPTNRLLKPTNQWERRPGESAKAYAAARVYFELGARRSIEVVAQRCRRSSSLWRRWSGHFQWVKRAVAYDAWADRLNQEALEIQAREAAKKWAEREEERREQKYQIAQKLAAKAIEMLEFPLATVQTKDGQTIVKPAKWTMIMAAQMAQMAYQLSGAAIRNDGAR
jgi:hypothetical protein